MQKPAFSQNGQLETRHQCALTTASMILVFSKFKISLRKLAHAIYRKNFGCKNENFQWKFFDIFLIFAQNIDCGYTLEPPRRGGSN